VKSLWILSEQRSLKCKKSLTTLTQTSVNVNNQLLFHFHENFIYVG
jgi:hypothetical protein